jgi:hypothetical protein
MSSLSALAALLMICPGHLTSLSAPTDKTTEAMRIRIDALRPANVAWRQIQWKSCLLEGLKESREKKKPLILWIFIDRPADDARC